MDDSTLLMQVANALGHLDNYVAREVLAEVGEFDDLMEEFSTFHDCNRHGVKFDVSANKRL